MSRPKLNPSLPTGPGQKILRAIGRYHQITQPQALRILKYSPASKTYVYQQLKQLVDQGYSERGDSDIKGTPAVWYLTKKGRRFLSEKGVDTDEPIDKHRAHSVHLAHRVAVVDVLIAFDELAEQDSRFVVLEMLNEVELFRHPTKVKLENGKAYSYAPDAWIHYSVDGNEGTIAFEVDRGSEEQKKWRLKIEGIMAMMSGSPTLYEQTFGLPNVTVAVIAVPGKLPIELRARNLHHWTSQEIERIKRPKWKSIFKVVPANPAAETASELILQPRWATPGSSELAPLLGALS